jgi:hypothetical protein
MWGKNEKITGAFFSLRIFKRFLLKPRSFVNRSTKKFEFLAKIALFQELDS